MEDSSLHNDATEKSVSVIIPAYNAASCLRLCLQSVFAQDLKPSQVIVVNDGSTDRTGEIAKEYQGSIMYTEQENRGPAVARNVGLSLAKGRFVAFLDADDYWQPTFLSSCVAFLLAHAEAVAVNTGQVAGKWGSRHIGPPGLGVDASAPQASRLLDNFFETWAKYDHVRTGSVVIRRSAIMEAGPQRPIRISEDLEYWGYLATFGKWGFIPQALWVSNSFAHAARCGWMRRYEIRRRLSPSIEEWEERIVPRLKPEDWPGFRVVRGRAAASLAFEKILGGDVQGARLIVDRHAEDMPCHWSARLMIAGYRWGTIGWKGACWAIRLRELLKALVVRVMFTVRQTRKCEVESPGVPDARVCDRSS